MSFLAKGGGKRVGMDVCIYSHIPKEGRYIEAHFSKSFFIVWCIYYDVGWLAICVSEKRTHKKP